MANWLKWAGNLLDEVDGKAAEQAQKLHLVETTASPKALAQPHSPRFDSDHPYPAAVIPTTNSEASNNDQLAEGSAESTGPENLDNNAFGKHVQDNPTNEQPQGSIDVTVTGALSTVAQVSMSDTMAESTIPQSSSPKATVKPSIQASPLNSAASPITTSSKSVPSSPIPVVNKKLDANSQKPVPKPPLRGKNPPPLPAAPKMPPVSALSSAPSIVPSAASIAGSAPQASTEFKALQNELRERNEEVMALRGVWHETREDLAKTKKLLSQQTENLRRKVEEKEEEGKAKLEAANQEHNKEIKKLRQEMADMQEQFEKSLGAKQALQVDQERGADELSKRLQTQQTELAAALRRIAELETERNELATLHAEQVEQHQSVLSSLREEQRRRDEAMEAQREEHFKALAQIQDREGLLEQRSTEHVSQLAHAEKQLEEKTRELARIQAENRWLHADHQAAKEELEAAKQRLELEINQRAGAQASAREKSAALTQRIEELTAELAAAASRESGLQSTINQLHATIDNNVNAGSQKQVTDLEQRLRTMADQLLHKTSSVSALNLELSTTQSRIQALSIELAELRARDGEEEDGLKIGQSKDPLDDLELGGARLRKREVNPVVRQQIAIRSKSIARAVSVLDSLGIQVGVLLRRNPVVRVSFMLYILLVHLWVIFVLYHFHNHPLPHPLDPHQP